MTLLEFLISLDDKRVLSSSGLHMIASPDTFVADVNTWLTSENNKESAHMIVYVREGKSRLCSTLSSRLETCDYFIYKTEVYLPGELTLLKLITEK